MHLESPEDAALSGYPAGEVSIIGTPARSPDDSWALVAYEVLAADSLYETSLCERGVSGWLERTSGSASPTPFWGWSATPNGSDAGEDVGVLSWFAKAPPGTRVAAVVLEGGERRFLVANGFYLGAIWGLRLADAKELASVVVRLDRTRFE
jgi:hypothetical protein